MLIHDEARHTNTCMHDTMSSIMGFSHFLVLEHMLNMCSAVYVIGEILS